MIATVAEDVIERVIVGGDGEVASDEACIPVPNEVTSVVPLSLTDVEGSTDDSIEEITEFDESV